MNGKGIVTTLDAVLQWFTRIVSVNVLWILFSLMGFLVGGIFPATAAALGVSRKWLMGDTEIKIWQTFKKTYRQEFFSANLLGWILLLIGLVLYWNFQLMAESAGEIPVFVPFAFYLVLFFYTMIAMWSFPLLVHYKGSWRQHLKNALIIGLTKIHYTVANFLVLFSIAYFSLAYPGFIPFFSISLSALCSMWFALQIFQKLDERPA